VKILMAARRFPPDTWSGSETVFENLYEQARRRHEVRLVVGYSRERGLVPAEAVATSLKGLPGPLAWARMALSIQQEVRRFKPDVVLSNSIEVPPSGAPSVCIVHDLNFGGSELSSRRMRERFYAAQARRLSAVVVVSAATARAMVAIGAPEERLRVIHNGVNLHRFHPVPQPASEVLRLIYPSRILPGKAQHLAIDAVARLRGEYKRRVRLTIAGAVVDRVYLDQLRVQAWQQPVDFALDVPDMATVIQQHDAALYPTLMEEGFGYSAVEAMATGLPVIWSEQPAIREATGGVGMPIIPGDVEGLRKAIAELVDDPARRRALGEAGRAHVEAHCSWERVWASYEAVLRSVAR
jgi:glycosyltransferase involved in cell wall biosynthesis